MPNSKIPAPFQKKFASFREEQRKTGDVGDHIIHFRLGKVGVDCDIQGQGRSRAEFQQLQTDIGQIVGDCFACRVRELFKATQRIGLDPPAKTLSRLFQPGQQTGLGNVLEI